MPLRGKDLAMLTIKNRNPRRNAKGALCLL